MAFSWALFQQIPVIGILRNLPEKAVKKIIPLYQEAGFTTLEITMNSPGASQMITETINSFGSGMNIGAGTVCTEQDLETALQAGAGFIVTPIINQAIIKTCVQRQIPIFPGAYTPTEIYTAWSWGATMVKVFPANKLGAEYIKEVRGPLDKIKLVPTGGVNGDNFTEFLRAGAGGVGMGGQLFSKILIDGENWEGLLMHFKKIRSAYEDYLINK
jgi:2-dehydro-3-deoxyphosphogluconate aldolase/(4S)-4-hydroxy-2-oxoglutarate aldolase